MGVILLEVNEENLSEHRSKLPTGLDYNSVHEYLNESYFWNEWCDFTKENIKQDFKIMYPGEYEIVELELMGDCDPFSSFRVHIKYKNERDQVMHILRWL